MKKLILHVEDDENDAFLFKHAMAKAGAGCLVRHAPDGQAAIDFFSNSDNARGSENRPDLVLLDLKLPEVPGLEVLKWIREAGLNVPVVILSSSENDHDVAQAYRLGANGYLVKPCDLDHLQEMAKMITGFWLVQNTPPPLRNMDSLDCRSAHAASRHEPHDVSVLSI